MCLNEFSNCSPFLNPALGRIAEFILEHPEPCRTMTIKQLAIACDVAESIVSRFVKEMNLNSYQDLKMSIAEALYSSEQGDEGTTVVWDPLVSPPKRGLCVSPEPARNVCCFEIRVFSR